MLPFLSPSVPPRPGLQRPGSPAGPSRDAWLCRWPPSSASPHPRPMAPPQPRSQSTLGRLVAPDGGFCVLEQGLVGDFRVDTGGCFTLHISVGPSRLIRFFPFHSLFPLCPPSSFHQPAIKSTPHSHLAAAAAGAWKKVAGGSESPAWAAAGDLGGTEENPVDWGRAFPEDSTEPTDCVFILITCHFYPPLSKLCPGEKST